MAITWIPLSHHPRHPPPSSLVLLVLLFAPARSATPTSYLDIRRTTTLPISPSTPRGGIEVDFLFRITAGGADFAPSPPKAPKEADFHPLTDTLNHLTSNKFKSGGNDDGNGSSSGGSGGNHISKNYPSYQLSLPPSDDGRLCAEALGTADYSNPAGNTDFFDASPLLPLDGRYVLVERGGCSFEAKARSAQRLGAAGVIVRNTLSSRYGLLDEAAAPSSSSASSPDWSNTRWPLPQKDYECGTSSSLTSTRRIGLRAEIPASLLSFSPPPYDGSHNDPILSGSMADGNLCSYDYALEYEEFRERCPSERCLLTGRNGTEEGGLTLEACCAWDVVHRMAYDGMDDDEVPQEEEETIVIPALFVTMEHGDELYKLIYDSERNNDLSTATVGEVEFISVVPYARYYPNFHWEGLLLWAMAVLALWASCWLSAGEYRRCWKVVRMAVDEGILVFQWNNSSSNGGGTGGNDVEGWGRRNRASTEDTIDLADDLELELAEGSGTQDLALNVEMTDTMPTTPATAPASGEAAGAGDVAAGEENNIEKNTVTAPVEEPIENEPKQQESNVSDEYVDDDVKSANNSSSGAATSSENNDTADLLNVSDNITTVAASNGEGGDSTMASEEELATAQNHEAEDISRNTTTDTAFPAEQQQQGQQQQQQQVTLTSATSTRSDMTMEIKAFHAVMFVIVASGVLFVLFFFNLYKVVRVVYGLGGSFCLSHIIFHPLGDVLSSKRPRVGKFLKTIPFRNLPVLGGFSFQWIDIICFVLAYGMGIAWIYIGFNRVDPLSSTYFWIVQDIMGVCYCILILGLIHINTIMVATVLLVLIFFYDIFYVFLTPYLFGTSVMIDVATGEGSAVDADHCEKYPFDKACMGSQAPLPMLLAVPWTNDFRGGASMIGLGDIIFPGLLISFASRFDAAKELVKRCSRTTTARNGAMNEDEAARIDTLGEVPPTSSSTPPSKRYHYHIGRIRKALFHGYFGPLVIAYAIGLILAYVAVWTTGRGQPALLYLVPCCLGTMLVLGWKKKQLSELWAGPKIMRKANQIVATANGIPAVREAAAREANSDLAETTSFV
mmetsp:Transcript_30332/g.63903  ORF Transcript_30332/g.63903 Transcript_30332/m.63903 type:complete len:1069 (-) Transcript_30332:282-3488(-)